MKIFIASPRTSLLESFLSDENIELLESFCELVWYPPDKVPDIELTKALISDCEAYITVVGAQKLPAEVICAAQRLRAVVYLGGVPLVDDQVWKSDIRVIGGEEYFAASAAEGTLSYILSVLRNIPEYSIRMKYKGEWRYPWDQTRSLMGKTVGIVNYGGVAARLMRLLVPFGVRVLVYDKFDIPAADKLELTVKKVPLDELFESADIITVHTPCHMDGYHMVDMDQISKMKQGSVLIDTSIGGVVNANSLLIALLCGRISAVLDVYENEPPVFDSSFCSLPNLILMPHMAGATRDIHPYVARHLICECADYLMHGTPPPHRVRPRRGRI